MGLKAKDFAPPTAILLGRKGSKGIPGKNSMRILGEKALHYPLQAAKQSKYVKELFTSTDDEDVASEAKKYGSKLIERPPELCTDAALFEDALEHGYRAIVESLGRPPEFLVVLMCNACTISSFLIDQAIEMLRENEEADSAVTVSEYNMWSPIRARKLNNSGYLDPFIPFENFGDSDKLSCDRDSQGSVFFADMSHSVCRPRCFEPMKGLLPQKWMGHKILPVMNECGCDIDYDWQIPMVEFWLTKNGFSEK